MQFFFVDKFRWRKQFRCIGIVPRWKFVGVDADIVYYVSQATRIEGFAAQIAEDLRLNGGDARKRSICCSTTDGTECCCLSTATARDISTRRHCVRWDSPQMDSTILASA